MGASTTSAQFEIDPVRTRLIEQFAVMTHRSSRIIFRKELQRKTRHYATLARKHPLGGIENKRFQLLPLIHGQVLAEIGEEPPPRRRTVRPKTPIYYPSLPDHLRLRLHFLAEGSLRRERAAALSQYAAFTYQQRSESGERFLSVAIQDADVALFERLVETLGDAGLSLPIRRTGGFSCYQSGCLTEPATRIADDNNHARTYSWRHTMLAKSHNDFAEPGGKPDVPDDLPWDPDPVFQDILMNTQANDLEAALTGVESINPEQREVLFDEVIYLKFCLRAPLRAQDVRYLARKYVRRSANRKRLEAEFEAFLGILDPLLPPWNDLEASYPWNRIRPWPAFKEHAYRTLKRFGHPIGPRGRLFVWSPDIYSGKSYCIDRQFELALRNAENAFRHERGVHRIGRKWRGESALFDLVSARFPDANAQWSPRWLGRQSVDVYVPSLNVAFEYHGEHHYRAIEFFGGEEGFKAIESRDAKKRARLARNGVALVEWRHDRPITDVELDRALRELETKSRD